MQAVKSGHAVAILDSLGRLFGKRGGKPEGRTISRHTFDADLPSHQFHQLFGDGQSQARASILACGRTVGLGESLEESLPRDLVNPYSRVRYREANNDVIVDFAFFFRTH